MQKDQLYFRSLSDQITLYWRKPDDAVGQVSYEIFLNGKPVGSTDRTHFTIDTLKPSQDYQAEVRMNGFPICTCLARTIPEVRRLNVRDFGAVGDGKATDTQALQKAIDACKPNEEVYLPAGIYKTGSLRLHSDMALHLDRDAVLQGTSIPEDYLPRILSRFEGTEMACYSALLNLGELDHRSGPNARNVLIYGEGTIASGGQELGMHIIRSEQERLRDYLSENAALVSTCENEMTIPGRVRPRLIQMCNCENVRITGLTLKNGACWNVHMIYSRNIVTDHCFICSEGVWNGDGWDPDSSSDCVLFATRFHTGDDCVAIKSGKNPEGNQIGRPCSGIRVFDCSSTLGHGICIGSEMSGGVEDVRVWDCDFTRAMYGMEIKSTPKRGGYVRDVHVTDCVLPRVMIHRVGYNDDGIPAETAPVFENISFRHLQLTGRALNRVGIWEDVSLLELTGFDVQKLDIKDIHRK